MKKIKRILCILITFVFLFSMGIVFADYNKNETAVSLNDELNQYVVINNTNILLYDENNKIINEYHTDGNIVSYEYKDLKLKKSSDTYGFTQEYLYDENGIKVKEYKDNKLLFEKKMADNNLINIKYTKEEKRVLAEKKLKKIKYAKKDMMEKEIILPRSTTSYEDYYVKSVLMNDIAYSMPNHASDYFVEAGVLTESEIQTFFENKNSILKDSVQIWRKNSDGTVYNTGESIIPSEAIYNAQQDTWVNAKVIIATLQKESSLVGATPGSVSYGSRRFYYAMGYGATDGGDINGTSGFDIQIQKGAELLYDLWVEAPYDMSGGVKMTVNNGIDKSSNGVTYKGYIWVLNWGTYALYRYTPWTIDTSMLPTIGGGNYLFYQIFKGYWGTDWQ